MNSKSTSAPKPKNWLLAKSRQWHTWGGLVAALFLLVVGTSGVILNYKQPIFSALGLERAPLKAEKTRTLNGNAATVELSTATGLSSLPVTFEQALQTARDQWGDVPLERIELKSEHGQTHYKIKGTLGDELWMNAATGTHFTKSQYEKIAKGGTATLPARQIDWGKILIDLHTGKIGGPFGKALMSAAAVVLVFLSLSGVYMWLKPLMIRRKNKQAKEATSIAPLPHSRPQQT
ncbi:MAG TPA: PepSY-associated TM helix domain-containing protein [Clostridia bacterium]|nr:PepSY-associated TM helix domain-containing protein [Clostridia bacterium]